MARVVGHALASISQDLTAIDGPTTVATANGLGQRNTVGTRVFDENGNEYIYLPGVASLVTGDWVTFNATDGTVVRLTTATAQAGPVAVAMAAFVASTWGWYQIFGFTPSTTNIATDAAGAGKALYSSATTGRASTTAAAGKAILGAAAIGNPASNAGQAFISYPYVMQNSTL